MTIVKISKMKEIIYRFKKLFPRPLRERVRVRGQMQRCDSHFLGSTNNEKENNMKPLIDLSTYQLIDIKKVKNLLPYSLNALLPKKEFAFTLTNSKNQLKD